MFAKVFFYYKRKFGAIDIKTFINKLLQIDNPRNIFLGRVYVGYNAWLAAMPLTGEQNCSLVIKDGSTIGNFNHIYATGSIIIEKNVLTADKVYISDNLHNYEDVTTPIKQQGIKQNGRIVIGEGAWLGENVCVLGASIGKNCVIGANSVVTHDIPDYSVAVGIPAKVIKRYDLQQEEWIKV